MIDLDAMVCTLVTAASAIVRAGKGLSCDEAATQLEKLFPPVVLALIVMIQFFLIDTKRKRVICICMQMQQLLAGYGPRHHLS